MSELLFEINGISSLGSVNEEEDLKPKGGRNISPPPNENCCDCCKRPQSELTPFVEDRFWFKQYRPYALYNELIQKTYDDFFGDCTTENDFQKAKEKIVRKYGETIAESITYCIEWAGHAYKSYECRDCFNLPDYYYYERRADRGDPPESCDCCGKHLGELKPFTEGDPVMDYFNGKLLARRTRLCAPPTDEANKIMDEFFGNCITYEDRNEALEKLTQKLGEEEAEKLWTFVFFLDGLFKSSWECRNCIVLGTYQYFEKKMAQEPDSAHDSSG